MNLEHGHEPDSSEKTTPRAKWVFIGFIIIAAYFLVTEHRAHLSGWLSSYGLWLFLLACPLMHLFMHSGHGGHGGEGAHGSHRDDGGEASDKQPTRQRK
jgi:SNF family Na+-dependent transporter